VCSIYLGEESIREEKSQRVLRGISGHNGGGCEGEGRKLYKEELHDSYCSNICGVVKWKVLAD
jgi:hypothetical protein